MLLLVLIIVLVAFGLLVVALLSGNVLVAWISVGMSVIAAVVLLIDWLQRRSAVKAGEELESTSVAMPATPQRLSDYEPATEVLPIVPAAPGASTGAPESNGAGAYSAAAADARFDHVDDAQQTIVMPVVPPSGQPSGSAARPSGAESDVTSSGGNSSLSVTKSGEEHGVAERSENPPAAPVWTAPDAESGDASPSVVESPTALVPAAEEPAAPPAAVPPTAAPPTAAPPGAAPVEAAPVDAPVEAAPLLDDAPEETRDAAVASVVAALDDEVVVIDEHPRYHVLGCRALDNRQVIPLPAREAVDLGFTPCGWCSPDRTLASRHQTTGS